MRVGTRTELTTQWGPSGHRPLAPIRIGYQFTHLFVALAPLTGQVFAMFLPTLNQACFQLFDHQLNEGLHQPTLLIGDRATAHKASLLSATQLTLCHLPTACPELNPVERFFKEVRSQLACRVFETLRAAEDCVIKVVQTYMADAERVVQLTAFPYIMECVMPNLN